MNKSGFLAVFFVLFFSATVFAAPLPPTIGAEAACLIVADTQKVLFDKHKDAIMYPASTTKIVTLLTALDHGKLDEVVTVSSKAAAVDGSSLDLQAGNRITLKELLTGMMLVSGNDAAEAVAEAVGGGSASIFIHWMNQEAERLGADRTHFTNPHGLPDPINHYTTAYDMARLTAQGYRNPEFLRIVSSIDGDVHFLNRNTLHVVNTNKLLRRYKDANGVKTGYTDAAGECLVAGAKRDGVQLIAVVFNSDTRWSDAQQLLDYGFQTIGAPVLCKGNNISK